MRIAIINQTFHPDVAATGQLMWDLARHLDASGHDVTAITSRQLYGTDKLHAQAMETHGRIAIHRLRGTAFGKKNIVGRLSDFGTFYLVAFWHLLRTGADGADVALVLTSPPLIGVVAALAGKCRRLLGRKSPVLVQHVMDLYPEALSAHGMMQRGHPLYKLFHWANGLSLAACHSVVALGEDMKDLILSKYPGRLDAGQLQVVQPWSEGDQLQPLPPSQCTLRRELGLEDSFNLVYSGNLGLAHDVETMVGAIEQSKGDGSLKWIFIGSGKNLEKLKARAEAEKWPHVRFLPFAPREQLCQSLHIADVHLVTQLPQWTGIVVPSKQFGIMAVGKPTLMVGPPGAEVSRVVIRHQCGRVVGNGDVVGLLLAIESLRPAALRAEMGMRAREAFLACYDRPVACKHLETLLLDAAASR